MSVASSVVSRASFILSGHAKLDALASDRSLVEKTMKRGHKVPSASSMGGYGNAGAWGIVRCIKADELDELLTRHEVVGYRGADLLADGSPLWHIVVEDMLRKGHVITNRLLLPGLFDVLEQLKEMLVGDSEDLSISDLHSAVQQLEPLLKVVYDGAKQDSKWKGQIAHHQLAPHLGLRKTLLNTFCDMPHDRHDLVQALLEYTEESLADPENEKRMRIASLGDFETQADDEEAKPRTGVEISLKLHTGLPVVAVALEQLMPGETFTVSSTLEKFGSINVSMFENLGRRIVVGCVSCPDKKYACLPGEAPNTLGLDMGSLEVLTFHDEHTHNTLKGPELDLRVRRSQDGDKLFFEGPVAGNICLPWHSSECWPAVGLWYSNTSVCCDRAMKAVAADKPWLVLCSVGFGHRESAQADDYGNTPIHCCAYNGNKLTLLSLLEHVRKYEDEWPTLRKAVLSSSTFVQKQQQRKGSTPLETALRQGKTDCIRLLEAYASPEKPPLILHWPSQALSFGSTSSPAEVDASQLCTLKITSASNAVCEIKLEVCNGQFQWSEELETRLTQKANEVGEIEKLQIKYMKASPGSGKHVCKLLQWARLRCRNLFWTNSEISLVDYLEILHAINGHIRNISESPLRWQRLGLGMGCSSQGGDTTLPVALMVQFAEALRNLVMAVAELPLGSVFEINVPNSWQSLLPEKERNICQVLGSLPDIHRWWQEEGIGQGKSKGKGKAWDKNPLSSNPFMPGLNRLKHVAVGGSWQALVDKHDFRAAIRSSTAAFLQLLLSSWCALMRGCNDHSDRADKLWNSFQQALTLLKDAPD